MAQLLTWHEAFVYRGCGGVWLIGYTFCEKRLTVRQTWRKPSEFVAEAQKKRLFLK